MNIYQHLFSSNILIIPSLWLILLSQSIYADTTAMIQYEYFSAESNYSNITQRSETNGLVSSQGSQSPIQRAQAFLLLDAYGRYDACQPPLSSQIYSNGIAIIQRGGDCSFSVKITRAKQFGASGRLSDQNQFIGRSQVEMRQHDLDLRDDRKGGSVELH